MAARILRPTLGQMGPRLLDIVQFWPKFRTTFDRNRPSAQTRPDSGSMLADFGPSSTLPRSGPESTTCPNWAKSGTISNKFGQTSTNTWAKSGMRSTNTVARHRPTSVRTRPTSAKIGPGSAESLARCLSRLARLRPNLGRICQIWAIRGAVTKSTLERLLSSLVYPRSAAWRGHSAHELAWDSIV